MMFPKSIEKRNSSRLESLASASVLACLGTWVLARCLLDMSKGDHASFAVGLAFVLLLAWTSREILRDRKSQHHQLILLPASLLWAAWMAHRGVDFFHWLEPSILLIAIFSSRKLVLPLMAIGLMLIFSMILLVNPSLHTCGMIASATIIAAMILLFRQRMEWSEATLRSRSRHLELTCQAVNILHVEIDTSLQVTGGSASLLEGATPSTTDGSLQLRDLAHPNDHNLLMGAVRNAMELNGSSLTGTIGCDCRLIFPGGEVAWMHASFARKDADDPGMIVAFVRIDGRLRIESALRETQRKLASQALELSAQFEATKAALHARQEMERIAQHDLRAPLKSIQATASLLHRSRMLSGKEDQLLTSIEQTAGRALAMVTMSLDLYRMEDGTFRFVPETIDLVGIGRSVISEFDHHARSKGVRLQFNASENTLKAIGNPMLTASIVENLVRNAIEAAPEHGAVTLGLYQGTRAGLLIHNDGEVDASVREDFFEKYATHGKRGGLGLGTYSARLIARAQGGDLTMTSSAEKGTLLLLKLGRSHAGSAPGALVAEVDARTSFGPSLPGHLIDLPLSTGSSTSPPPIDLLVVEDDDHNWLILSNWLPGHVAARRAINGREAIEALIVKKPDLVVMDIEMPIMGGFEALHRIREMQSSAGEAPSIVYAFTGYDDQETMRRVREAGFDGILSKPVQQVEFEDMLRTVSGAEAFATARNDLWIEKSFMTAFPTFIASRTELIDRMERAVQAGDMNGVRHNAHTLAGSPAIHGFERGIWLCQRIIAMASQGDVGAIDQSIVELRKMFYKPVIR
ncbi:response regulator [Comamonadaceae bacterium OTU4NAUVB1]|nr:response regulator [Comamonadaceae bacterium OTU4NAUVB1]